MYCYFDSIGHDDGMWSIIMTFMQGVCKYVPETNNVHMVCSVAAIPYFNLVYM